MRALVDLPLLPDPRDKWAYRAANAPMLVLGLLAVLATLQFIFVQDLSSRSILGRELGALDDAYNIAWMVGGLLVIGGVWTVNRLAEAIGCAVYFLAVLANTVAVFDTAPDPFTYSSASLVALDAAMLTRALYLVWHMRLGER